MPTDREQLCEWAVQLAGLGWHVFSLTPRAKKPPMVTDWENRASTDLLRIRHRWERGAFNIGIATGPSGLVVIDLDVPDQPGAPDGAQQLAEIAAARGVRVPETYTVRTPTGGSHLYYRCPPGVNLRNSQGEVAPDIDVRAGGGYVVGAGSVRPDGAYELTDDQPPVELPGWLVQVLSEKRSTAISAANERPVTDLTRYTTTAMDRECERVRQATRGQHNRVLSNAAYNLGQLIGARLLDEPTAVRELTNAAEHMPGLGTGGCHCTPREIARVINAGLAAGARNPRRQHQPRKAA